MEKYLDALHRKPNHHKKRFALLASATITLFIFGIWSITTFGINGGILARIKNTSTSPEKIAKIEISPLQSLRMNLSSSWEAFMTGFNELKNGMKDVNFEAEYQDMREKTLDIYGQ